jgi:hypothetical protein
MMFHSPYMFTVECWLAHSYTHAQGVSWIQLHELWHYPT